MPFKSYSPSDLMNEPISWVLGSLGRLPTRFGNDNYAQVLKDARALEKLKKKYIARDYTSK